MVAQPHSGPLSPHDGPSSDVSPTVGSHRRGSDGSLPPKKVARRAFLTQNACSRCRVKKSKCDGKRPMCARCIKDAAECKYDVSQEGLTRMQSLQQQLQVRTRGNDEMTELFSALRRGSDHQATTLLARLRLGESVEDLVASLRGGPSAHDAQSPLSLQSPNAWNSRVDENAWTSWSSRCQPDVQEPSPSSASSHSEAHSFHPTLVENFVAREDVVTAADHRYHIHQQFPLPARNPQGGRPVSAGKDNTQHSHGRDGAPHT